jgi:hypothetical protein
VLEGFIFRSTTAEKVLAFETENGIVLPEDYRRFLTTDAPHPGSVSGPVDEVMPVLKIYCPAAYAWFGDFFCIGADFFSLELDGEVALFEDFEGGVDIASSQGGETRWMMSVIEPDYGYVYHCEHLDTEYFCAHREDYLVARSFVEFLTLVEPPNAREVLAQQILEETGPERFRYPSKEFWEKRPRDPDAPPENVLAPKRWWEILLGR